MVNGGLKSLVFSTMTIVRPQVCAPGRDWPRESCINQPNPWPAGAIRSCFGPADSWFIKEAGGSSCRGELRVRAKLTLYSRFVVSSRPAPDDSWDTHEKALFAGDNHADTAHILLRIRRRSGADR